MIMTNTTAEDSLFIFVQSVKTGYLAQLHKMVFDRILQPRCKQPFRHVWLITVESPLVWMCKLPARYML